MSADIHERIFHNRLWYAWALRKEALEMARAGDVTGARDVLRAAQDCPIGGRHFGYFAHELDFARAVPEDSRRFVLDRLARELAEDGRP